MHACLPRDFFIPCNHLRSPLPSSAAASTTASATHATVATRAKHVTHVVHATTLPLTPADYQEEVASQEEGGSGQEKGGSGQEVGQEVGHEEGPAEDPGWPALLLLPAPGTTRRSRAALLPQAPTCAASGPPPPTPSRPQRKPSAYINFCKKERPAIVKANSKLTFGEVGKALGAKWAKMSDADKKKFA